MNVFPGGKFPNIAILYEHFLLKRSCGFSTMLVFVAFPWSLRWSDLTCASIFVQLGVKRTPESSSYYVAEMAWMMHFSICIYTYIYIYENNDMLTVTTLHTNIWSFQGWDSEFSSGCHLCVWVGFIPHPEGTPIVLHWGEQGECGLLGLPVAGTAFRWGEFKIMKNMRTPSL